LLLERCEQGEEEEQESQLLKPFFFAQQIGEMRVKNSRRVARLVERNIRVEIMRMNKTWVKGYTQRQEERVGRRQEKARGNEKIEQGKSWRRGVAA
jgi:hypothetical protein